MSATYGDKQFMLGWYDGYKQALGDLRARCQFQSGLKGKVPIELFETLNCMEEIRDEGLDKLLKKGE